MHSQNLLSHKQYGFTPQTGTIDTVMDLKEFVQESLKEGSYIALISIEVQGAFDAVWWPGIINLLKNLQCPRNLYKFCVSYFNERKAVLTLNSRQEQRAISKGCPQGSASRPGFWNMQFNPLLNLEYSKTTKVIAYADDLLILTKGNTQVEVENYTNIEMQKVTAWARENKIIFIERKSKLMIITRRRPKI